MQDLRKQYEQLYEWIDNLLWEEWDPIGVNDIAPRDEYQSYTPKLFTLATNGATVEEITQELLRIEMHTMGLFGNRQRCMLIAQKIVDRAKENHR